jgi:hypothetical protein
MSFDNVVVDERCVASRELFRNAMLALELGESFTEDDFLFNFESVLFEMADPAVAALSSRSLVDGNCRDRKF